MCVAFCFSFIYKVKTPLPQKIAFDYPPFRDLKGNRSVKKTGRETAKINIKLSVAQNGFGFQVSIFNLTFIHEIARQLAIANTSPP